MLDEIAVSPAPTPDARPFIVVTVSGKAVNSASAIIRPPPLRYAENVPMSPAVNGSWFIGSTTQSYGNKLAGRVFSVLTLLPAGRVPNFV